MRPRKLLRIARWETTKGVGGVDRGAVAVAVAATAFVLAVGVAVAGGGVALEDGIYRVGVSEDSRLHDPIAADSSFAVVEPDPTAIESGTLPAGGRYDLYIEERGDETTLYLAAEGGAPTDKSRAAVAALRESVDRYNDQRMFEEDN